jgi:hypothetical protein
MKRFSFIFLTAFFLNLVWENAHVFLYDNYQGGRITEFILIKASLFDAIMVTSILAPFLYVAFLKKRAWLIIVIATIVAVVNEWYGLTTGRWEYNSLMPTLPFLETGITPTFQLAITSLITFFGVKKYTE